MTEFKNFSDSSNNESIKKAIRLSWWMVTFPSIMGMFAVIALFFILVKLDFFSDTKVDGLVLLMSFVVVGFVTAWLIWSIQVPKWRLKAYTMVDDIVALKQEAVGRQIIWPEGSWIEKTEIASKQLKEKILEIERAKTKPTELRDTSRPFRRFFSYLISIIAVCAFVSIFVEACKRRSEKMILIAQSLEERN